MELVVVEQVATMVHILVVLVLMVITVVAVDILSQSEHQVVEVERLVLEGTQYKVILRHVEMVEQDITILLLEVL